MFVTIAAPCSSSVASGRQQVNGVDLYYEQTGRGKHAVLLLPGALGKYFWQIVVWWRPLVKTALLFLRHRKHEDRFQSSAQVSQQRAFHSRRLGPPWLRTVPPTTQRLPPWLLWAGCKGCSGSDEGTVIWCFHWLLFLVSVWYTVFVYSFSGLGLWQVLPAGVERWRHHCSDCSCQKPRLDQQDGCLGVQRLRLPAGPQALRWCSSLIRARELSLMMMMMISPLLSVFSLSFMGPSSRPWRLQVEREDEAAHGGGVRSRGVRHNLGGLGGRDRTVC